MAKCIEGWNSIFDNNSNYQYTVTVLKSVILYPLDYLGQLHHHLIMWSTVVKFIWALLSIDCTVLVVVNWQ